MYHIPLYQIDQSSKTPTHLDRCTAENWL